MRSGAAPGALGFRWPAEWEPHAATWLAWPHNPDTWPGRLDRTVAAHARFVRELQESEPVRLLVNDAAAEAGAARALRVAGARPEEIAFHRVPTDDAWIRDYGPIVLVRGRERIAADFRFDCWGRKYPDFERDDAVPARLEAALGLPRLRADFVLEGGAVDGNGAGTLLTTESCLLNPNRGPGRDRPAMERRLADWLGARRVVWLGAGIEGDDTDGHVDDVARFVDATTVVAAVENDPADRNAGPLAENLRRLREARDAGGRPLSVVPLPMPPPLVSGGRRCPASYANFYLTDVRALVPTFGVREDERALAVLREVLPAHQVVGVPSADLVPGLGALHCLSQQEPRPEIRAC